MCIVSILEGWGWGGVARFFRSNEKKQVSFIPTRPPTTYVHTAFHLRKHTECGKVSATHVLVEKRYGIRGRLVAGPMNLQSQGTQDAFYLRKHKGSGGVGTARIFH